MFSYDYALLCATARVYLYCNQEVPNSFCRHGVVRPHFGLPILIANRESLGMRQEPFWPSVEQNKRKSHICPEPPFPFNALFRHSMHRNTVRRKVWSHTVNSGKLFFVTEGVRGQSK